MRVAVIGLPLTNSEAVGQAIGTIAAAMSNFELALRASDPASKVIAKMKNVPCVFYSMGNPPCWISEAGRDCVVYDSPSGLMAGLLGSCDAFLFLSSERECRAALLQVIGDSLLRRPQSRIALMERWGDVGSKNASGWEAADLESVVKLLGTNVDGFVRLFGMRSLDAALVWLATGVNTNDLPIPPLHPRDR